MSGGLYILTAANTAAIAYIFWIKVRDCLLNIEETKSRGRWEQLMHELVNKHQLELEALRSDIKDLRRAKPLVTIEEDEEGNERTVFNCFR